MKRKSKNTYILGNRFKITENGKLRVLIGGTNTLVEILELIE